MKITSNFGMPMTWHAKMELQKLNISKCYPEIPIKMWINNFNYSLPMKKMTIRFIILL